MNAKSTALMITLAAIARALGDKGYVCKEAHNRQQAMQLIELGFEYILTDKEGVSLFRKIK